MKTWMVKWDHSGETREKNRLLMEEPTPMGSSIFRGNSPYFWHFPSNFLPFLLFHSVFQSTSQSFSRPGRGVRTRNEKKSPSSSRGRRGESSVSFFHISQSTKSFFSIFFLKIWSISPSPKTTVKLFSLPVVRQGREKKPRFIPMGLSPTKHGFSPCFWHLTSFFLFRTSAVVLEIQLNH